MLRKNIKAHLAHFSHILMQMHVNGSWKAKKLVQPLQVPLPPVQLQRPQQQQRLQRQPQRQAQQLKFHQQQKLSKLPPSSLRNFAILLILVGCVRWKTNNTHSV